MRKCFEIVVQGLRTRGVVHLPEPGTASGFEGLGVIVLHPGFLPRSAQADSAVALADALARIGLPTVRVDLPGLGDSEGDLPEDSFTFIDMVQEGAFADIALECVESIKAQLGWRRVIIGGHCGGAITALFALAAHKLDWVAGLFALDVIYYVVRPMNPPVKNAQGAVVRPPQGLRREALRKEFRLALLKTPLGGPLQKLAQRSREILKRLRFGSRPESAPPTAADVQPTPAAGALPAEANVKLLKCVEQVLRSGLPILFITADDPTKPSDFDYAQYLMSRCAGRACHKRISGTDHGFISGDGKARVSECVAQWIVGEFRNPAPRHATASRM
jgi:pimeloyl-ACP methyl ester carboxylesterase